MGVPHCFLAAKVSCLPQKFLFWGLQLVCMAASSLLPVAHKPTPNASCAHGQFLGLTLAFLVHVRI